MDTRRLLLTLLIVGGLFITVKALFPGVFGGNVDNTKYIANPIYDNVAAQPMGSEQGAVPTQVILGDFLKIPTSKLAVTVDNVTAGIDLVQLNANDYSENVKSTEHPIPEPLTLLQAYPGVPKPYSTLGVNLTVGGQKIALPNLYLRQYIWKFTKETDTEADLVLTLGIEKNKPLARITKIFRIDPTTYEITVTHQVENLSGLPITISVDQMAATDLPRDNVQTDDRFYHAAALSTEKKSVDATRFNATHAEFQKLNPPEKEPLKIGTKDVGQLADFSGTSKDPATLDPILWIAASNRFFVAITRPLPCPGDPLYTLNDGAKRQIPEPSHVASAALDVLRHDPEDASKTITGIRLNGATLNLPVNASTSLPLSIYLGPKKREILDGNPAAAAGSDLYNYDLFQYTSVIQLSSGGCFIYTFCTFDWLARAILWLLNFLVKFMPWQNYGLAIMLLVIAVRGALHPLTRASQVNMAVMGKKMRAVQPKLEAAKKRYAKEPKKLQEEQMRIYRENDVNPAGGLLGCLPMFIQMPIWIALFNSLRTDIDLRHAMFIPGWITDLSNPDALITLAHPFTLPMMGTIASFNLLPILLGIVFFLQMKVQTASQPAAADPSQAKMQKMSSYMILLFPLFLYNAPSGLNVYMFASTMGGLVDTYFVRKTLKRRGILPVTASNLPTQEIMEADEFNKKDRD